ncbi:RteC domain-containing protein [Bacteroidales bacterium OttesenSCG-928-I14]|nr:RteC domain-containing protein [Bacteroidales bacterium OttesenSCG-928-I14]
MKETMQKVRQIESAEKDELRRAFSTALVFAEANSKLKNFIIDYQFESEEEEISFFKQAKPALVSQLIYHCQIYNIEMNRPLGGTEIQRAYLNAELENLQDYIDRRAEFYSYYRLGSTHNDVYYFTREKFVLGLQYLEPTISEREPKYSTNCDYKMAKILANEKLEALLKSQLNELERPALDDASPLGWATSKRNLIELLYALDSFHAFGNISLKRVLLAIEKLVGVKLGNASSIFAEMRTRNNPTPFLDELKNAMLRRMRRKENRKKGRNNNNNDCL